jgi:glutathione synthase/RimK-type ligase-like ATP-grasp enzyme
LLKDRVKGPESLLIEGDTIYTTPEDGRVLKIINGKVAKEVILVKDKDCRKDILIAKNNKNFRDIGKSIQK